MKHMIAMVSKEVAIKERKKRAKKYAPRGKRGPSLITEHLICFHNGYWFWFSRPMWSSFTGTSPATLYTREKQIAIRPIRQIVGLDKWVQAPKGRRKGSPNIKGKKK